MPIFEIRITNDYVNKIEYLKSITLENTNIHNYMFKIYSLHSKMKEKKGNNDFIETHDVIPQKMFLKSKK